VSDIISIAIANGFAFYAVNAIFNRFGAGYTNPFFAVAFNWFRKDKKERSISRRLLKVMLLILMEFIGSVLAALLIWGIIGDGTLATGLKLDLGRPNNYPGRTFAQALGFEIVGTFVLAFTVIFANSDLMFHPDIALIGGLMVVGLNVVGIPISGASMNWVRHFGPTVVSNSWKGTDWIYYVGPLCGASVVFILYRIVIFSMRKNK
jgi:aquaporin related protein